LKRPHLPMRKLAAFGGLFSFVVALASSAGAQQLNSVFQSDLAVSAQISRKLAQDQNVRQAAYVLAARATNDADGYALPPAPTSGTSVVGGGLIPASSGAPATDGFGVKLGYCAWDNGTATSASGYLPGSNSLAAIALAVVSPGADNTFQTTCASILAGLPAAGDDYYVAYTSGQILSGVQGTAYFADPVNSVADLNSIAASSLKDGQVRLVKATNQLYRYSSGSSSWTSVSSQWMSSATPGDIHYTAGRVAIGTTTAIRPLTVAGSDATGVPLALSSSGNRNGLDLFDSTSSTTRGSLVFDRATATVRLEASQPGTAIALVTSGGTVTVGSNGVLNATQGITSGPIAATSITATGGVTTSLIQSTGPLSITAPSTTVSGNLAVNGVLNAAGGLQGTAANFSGTVNAAAVTVNGNAVWHTGNFNPGAYVAKSGDQMSGPLGVSATPNALSGIYSGSNTDTFVVDSDKVLSHYGLTWKQFSDGMASGPSAALSGYGGIRFYTTGKEAGRFDAQGSLIVGQGNGVAKLTVVGGVSQAGGEGTLYLQSTSPSTIAATVSGASTGSISISGGSNVGARGGQIDFNAGGWQYAPGTLVFRTGTATGGTPQPERMRLDANGNLGINTTAPQYRVDVASENDIAIRLNATGSNGTGIWMTRGGVGAAAIGVGPIYSPTAGLNDLTVVGARDVVLATNGQTEQMRVSNGRVGIGATAINGNNQSRLAVVENELNNGMDVRSYRSDTSNGYRSLTTTLIQGSGANSSYNGNVAIKFHHNDWRNLSGDLSFWTKDNDNVQYERMRLDATGNFSIGTSVADARVTMVGSGNQNILTLRGNTTGAARCDFCISRSGSATDAVGQGANIQLGNSSNATAVLIQESAGSIQFMTSTPALGWAERMRIGNSGQVAINLKNNQSVFDIGVNMGEYQNAGRQVTSMLVGFYPEQSDGGKYGIVILGDGTSGVSDIVQLLNGTFTFNRGSAGSWNRNQVTRVAFQRAYNGPEASIQDFAAGSAGRAKIVSFTYSGKRYYGLTYGLTSSGAIWFDGKYFNANDTNVLRLVTSADVTGLTTIKNFETVGGGGETKIYESGNFVTSTKLVANADGTDVSVGMAGDMVARRSDDSGVIYFGNSGLRYLYSHPDGYTLPNGAFNLSRLTIDANGSISKLQGVAPQNGVIRLTPNLHLNAGAGYAAIINWDNGTTGGAQALRVGNGAGADVMTVLANGVGWYAGSVSAAGFVTASDAAFKQNIHTLDTSILLQKFMAVRPVSYNLKATGEYNTGYIAQEVAALFPHMVQQIDPQGHLGVNYTQMIPVLHAVAQRHEQQIQDLKNTKLDSVTNHWISSTDQKGRFYFEENGKTVIKGHGDIAVEFRNAEDQAIAAFRRSGDLDLMGVVTFKGTARGGFAFNPTGTLVSSSAPGQIFVSSSKSMRATVQLQHADPALSEASVKVFGMLFGDETGIGLADASGKAVLTAAATADGAVVTVHGGLVVGDGKSSAIRLAGETAITASADGALRLEVPNGVRLFNPKTKEVVISLGSDGTVQARKFAPTEIVEQYTSCDPSAVGAIARDSQGQPVVCTK
jgi:hypothetical protein